MLKWKAIEKRAQTQMNVKYLNDEWDGLRSICRSMSPNTNFIAQNIQFFFLSVEYLEKMHQCHTFNVLFLFQKCVGNALVCSSFQALYKGTLNIPFEIKHHTWMLCRISFAVENNCIVLISVSIHSFVRYLTICLKQTATTIRRNWAAFIFVAFLLNFSYSWMNFFSSY